MTLRWGDASTPLAASAACTSVRACRRIRGPNNKQTNCSGPLSCAGSIESREVIGEIWTHSGLFYAMGLLTFSAIILLFLRCHSECMLGETGEALEPCGCGWGWGQHWWCFDSLGGKWQVTGGSLESLWSHPMLGNLHYKLTYVCMTPFSLWGEKTSL